MISSMRIAPERSPPGQQLVEDHAQAEDVRSPIDPVPFAPGLLGTHVGGCPSEPATLAEVLVLEGQPEVRDARLARGVDQDVGGLDVPVDQPSGVGVMQGLGDRGDQFRRIPEGRASLPDPDRQVAAFDELGDDEAEAVVRATHVIDRHDVGWSSLARMRASFRYASTSSGCEMRSGFGTLIATGRSRSSSWAR